MNSLPSTQSATSSPSQTEFVNEETVCDDKNPGDEMIITYQVVIDPDDYRNTKIQIEISGYIPNPLYLSQIFDFNGAYFTPLDMFIHSDQGEDIEFKYNPEYSYWPYQGRYRVTTNNSDRVIVNYGVESSYIVRYNDLSYYCYLSENKIACQAGLIFLVPIYSGKKCLKVQFDSPSNLQIFTPWAKYLDGYDPGSPYTDDLLNMAKTSFEVGDYSRYSRDIKDQKVFFVIDNDLPIDAHREMSDGFFDLYRFYADLFDYPGAMPYQAAIFSKPSEDYEIYVGEWSNGQGWTVDSQGVSISDDLIGGHWVPWREYGHQLFHAWESPNWGEGIITPKWVAEGINEFYKYKSSYKTHLINDADTRYMYEHEFISAYHDLLQADHDYSLATADQAYDLPISGSEQNTLVYKKSALFAALLAREIYLRTGGEFTIDDFIRTIYHNYRGDKSCMHSCLLFELDNLTGADFSDLFNSYIHGKELIPLEWTFEDDDNDGRLNIFEVFMDDNPNNPSSTVEYKDELFGSKIEENIMQVGEPVLTDEQGDVLNNRGSMDLLKVFKSQDEKNAIWRFEFANEFHPSSSRIDFWLTKELDCNIKVTLEGRETQWNNWNYSDSGINLYDECDKMPMSQEGAFTSWSGTNVTVQIPISVIGSVDNIHIDRVEIFSYQDWEIYDYAEMP